MKSPRRRKRETPPPAHEAQAKFTFAGHAEWSVSKTKCFRNRQLQHFTLEIVA
jgi:hypothetical protein